MVNMMKFLLVKLNSNSCSCYFRSIISTVKNRTHTALLCGYKSSKFWSYVTELEQRCTFLCKYATTNAVPTV